MGSTPCGWVKPPFARYRAMALARTYLPPRGVPLRGVWQSARLLEAGGGGGARGGKGGASGAWAPAGAGAYPQTASGLKSRQSPGQVVGIGLEDQGDHVGF